MKILLFGHSYVRHLERLGNWDRELSLTSGKKVDCKFLFKSHSSKDYGYLLRNPQEFEIIRLIDPDIIVVILGGNYISDKHSNIEINDMASEFYNKLKQVVRLDCLRLAVQIEPRFVDAGNKFGMPEAEEYNRRRTVVNNYVNKKLKKYGLVDNVILPGSVNYLRDPKYFSDGVHLKTEGLLMYKEVVIGRLKCALENKNV